MSWWALLRGQYGQWNSQKMGGSAQQSFSLFSCLLEGELVLVYDQEWKKLGVGNFKPLWHSPYVIKCVLQKGVDELDNHYSNPFLKLHNGIYLKIYFAWMLCLWCIICIIVWCVILLLLVYVQFVLSIYSSWFLLGDSCYTKNISFVAWIIFSPMIELMILGGIYLGPVKDNVVEYSVVIELLLESISHGICHLDVNLQSRLLLL